MIPQEIKTRAIRRFTNLIDGSVLPHVSVSMILEFIESNINTMPIGNIEQQFVNAEIDAMTEDDEINNWC